MRGCSANSSWVLAVLRGAESAFLPNDSCHVGWPHCSSCYSTSTVSDAANVATSACAGRGGIWLFIQYNQDILVEYLLLLTWVSYFIVLNLSDLVLKYLQ